MEFYIMEVILYSVLKREILNRLTLAYYFLKIGIFIVDLPS